VFGGADDVEEVFDQGALPDAGLAVEHELDGREARGPAGGDEGLQEAGGVAGVADEVGGSERSELSWKQHKKFTEGNEVNGEKGDRRRGRERFSRGLLFPAA
jgi:hypothetical protein